MAIIARSAARHAGYGLFAFSRGSTEGPSGEVPRRTTFCRLPLTIGLTVEGVVDAAFAAAKDGRTFLTTFINPHAFHVAKRDPRYAEALASFDLVLPDGIGIVWGLRALTGRSTPRISFDSTSLALPVLRRARQEAMSVMLIGGRPGVAEQAARRLAQAVPGLAISAALDGFRGEADYVAEVRHATPDIILCSMGAPRQEALLLRLREAAARHRLSFTCGGYFDQLQDGVRYYPVAADRLNCRWLYRLLREPRRLGRRYLLEYQDCFQMLLREAWPGRAPTPTATWTGASNLAFPDSVLDRSRVDGTGADKGNGILGIENL